MRKIDFALEKQTEHGLNEDIQTIIISRCPAEYGLKNIEKCMPLAHCDECWDQEIDSEALDDQEFD
jgi:hypothetical protein